MGGHVTFFGPYLRLGPHLGDEIREALRFGLIVVLVCRLFEVDPDRALLGIAQVLVDLHLLLLGGHAA